ncbi:S-layer domain-containing protein [Gottschalkia acidurici 9a]|uniref:S-layer domain-containing protein n=1 Tax=Gottschalkia acidurici (strain ATCC 7906 / DSM 604 / BCRC 14475 / CIP 104303 / KCTC 5404 / NCIMB 10678 / 9a) TaxID=1128398 RepID=K0AUT5_GOTA9|nr:YcdB/YcdC domain-containing protein [Gottschalkia acidurici]AFS77643.1 S-layer domain-containing protein [Gottschalkia acidurici 9a]
MKKKISLALSVGVLLTTLSPVQGFAKTNNTEIVLNSEVDVEKYIPRIKSIFQIGDEYDNFYVLRNGRSDTIGLDWVNDNGNISVDIDRDGNVVGYWKHENYTNRDERVYKFPKITIEEGEKIAKDLINKVFPEISNKIEKNMKYGYDTYNMYSLGEYSYNFIRTENDVPFENNTIYVRVDNQKGEVTSFSSSIEKNLRFPGKEGIMSEDEAKELYKENVGLELMYKLRGIDNGFEPYLGYSITSIDKVVDARTKDIVSNSQQYYYHLYEYNQQEELSSEEESKLVNSKVIISKQDASEKMIDTFKLGEGYEVSGHQLVKCKEKDQYIWYMMVSKNEENYGSASRAELDAKTGQIISFSDPGSSGVYERESSKYSKEELLKKAKDFIQKSNPEKYKEVEYVENNDMYVDGEIKVYDFQFIKKLNDIKVENSGFRVTISAVTGNIVGYNYNWDDSDLPLVENIIDKDKAKSILLDDKTLELQYQSENNDQKNIKLVYDFKDKHLSIDAKTGEIIDNRNEIMNIYGKSNYRDIENSFAKDQIKRLQENIVLFEGEDFKPKSEITQKDFLSLLIQTKESFYPGSDEEFLYELLVMRNIIEDEEKNPEGKVTREEAIKYIVRAFGQEQSDDPGDIYKIGYNDEEQIDEKLKGNVAIAKGLGIISGEGNFRPKDNLRRDEAAVLIYNILNRSN